MSIGVERYPVGRGLRESFDEEYPICIPAADEEAISLVHGDCGGEVYTQRRQRRDSALPIRPFSLSPPGIARAGVCARASVHGACVGVRAHAAAGLMLVYEARGEGPEEEWEWVSRPVTPWARGPCRD